MAEKREFHPCYRWNCRFYGEWVFGWNETEELMCLPKPENAKKIDPHQLMLICLSCMNFERQNNFIEA